MTRAETATFEPVDRELDLTIGKRLALGFGALLLVILIFAAAVWIWHSQSVAAQRDYTDHIEPLSARVDLLERSLLYVGISMRSYLLAPQPERLANYRSYTEQARASLVQVASTAAYPEGAPDIRHLSASVREYLESTDVLVEKRYAGALDPAEEAAVVDLREASLEQVHRLIDPAEGADRNSRSTYVRRSRQGDLWNGCTVRRSAPCFAWGSAGSRRKSIRRPTRALVRVAGAMERGEWEPALHLAPTLSDDTAPRSEMLRPSRAIGSGGSCH